LEVFLRQKWTGGVKARDLRLAQVFNWGKSAKEGFVLTPK
jgi:hypothetical protein